MFDVINLKQSKKKYFVFLIAKYKKKETEVYNKCIKLNGFLHEHNNIKKVAFQIVCGLIK